MSRRERQGPREESGCVVVSADAVTLEADSNAGYTTEHAVSILIHESRKLLLTSV